MGICAMHMDHNEKDIENFGDKFFKSCETKASQKENFEIEKNRILT